MNNISFRAKIHGLPLDVTAKLFEMRTEDDTKHEIRLLERTASNNKDTFVMSKNGKVTVEYQPTFTPRNPGLYKPVDLVRIFQTMKHLEAQNVLKKSLAARKTQLKKADYAAFQE